MKTLLHYKKIMVTMNSIKKIKQIYQIPSNDFIPKHQNSQV